MIRDEEFSTILNNKATFRGFTALHYAAIANNFEIVKLLLSYGANPTLETEAGHKAFQYAKEGPIKQYIEQKTNEVFVCLINL